MNNLFIALVLTVFWPAGTLACMDFGSVLLIKEKPQIPVNPLTVKKHHSKTQHFLESNGDKLWFNDAKKCWIVGEVEDSSKCIPRGTVVDVTTKGTNVKTGILELNSLGVAYLYQADSKGEINRFAPYLKFTFASREVHPRNQTGRNNTMEMVKENSVLVEVFDHHHTRRGEYRSVKRGDDPVYKGLGTPQLGQVTMWGQSIEKKDCGGHKATPFQPGSTSLFEGSVE